LKTSPERLSEYKPHLQNMKKSLEYAYIVDISDKDPAAIERKRLIQAQIDSLTYKLEHHEAAVKSYDWVVKEANELCEKGNIDRLVRSRVIQLSTSGKWVRPIRHAIRRLQAKLEQVGKYKVYAYHWLKEKVTADERIVFGPELCDSPYPVDIIVFNDAYNTPGTYVGQLGRNNHREGTLSYKDLSNRMRQLTAKEIEEICPDWAEGCVWRCIRENREAVRPSRRQKRKRLKIGKTAIHLEYNGDQYFENDDTFRQAYQRWLENLADSAFEKLVAIKRLEEATILHLNVADLLHVVKNAYGCKGSYDPQENAWEIESEYRPFYERRHMNKILQQGYNNEIEDNFEWGSNETANLIKGMKMAKKAFELCETCTVT